MQFQLSLDCNNSLYSFFTRVNYFFLWHLVKNPFYSYSNLRMLRREVLLLGWEQSNISITNENFGYFYFNDKNKKQILLSLFFSRCNNRKIYLLLDSLSNFKIKNKFKYSDKILSLYLTNNRLVTPVSENIDLFFSISTSTKNYFLCTLDYNNFNFSFFPVLSNVFSFSFLKKNYDSKYLYYSSRFLKVREKLHLRYKFYIYLKNFLNFKCNFKLYFNLLKKILLNFYITYLKNVFLNNIKLLLRYQFNNIFFLNLKNYLKNKVVFLRYGFCKRNLFLNNYLYKKNYILQFYKMKNFYIFRDSYFKYKCKPKWFYFKNRYYTKFMCDFAYWNSLPRLWNIRVQKDVRMQRRKWKKRVKKDIFLKLCKVRLDYLLRKANINLIILYKKNFRFDMIGELEEIIIVNYLKIYIFYYLKLKMKLYLIEGLWD